LPPKLSPFWAHSHQKDAPAGVAAEETKLWRLLHRSMLRLLTVEAAEQRESHCTAASSLCLDQPAAAVEPIDACKLMQNESSSCIPRSVPISSLMLLSLLSTPPCPSCVRTLARTNAFDLRGFCAKTETQHTDSKHDCTLCALSGAHASPAKHVLH